MLNSLLFNENKKSIRDEDVCVDCTITDVEENYDFHLPMFVQHTEALLNETNEMVSFKTT